MTSPSSSGKSQENKIGCAIKLWLLSLAVNVKLNRELSTNFKSESFELATYSLFLFFSDAFYIQFFQSAFPDIDFSSLEETNNEEEMAMNIQTLIDLLSQEILRYDLSHIRGD